MPTLSDAQVAGYAKGANFTGSDVAIAVAIAHAESGCNTDVTHANANGSVDYGLMQINSVHADLLASGSWKNPADNMRMAHMIYIGAGGWTPWSTYNNGAYLVHMSKGLAAANSPTIKPSSSTSPTANIVPAVSVSDVTDGIGSFVGVVTNPHTYLRVAEFVAGLLLLMIAVIGLDRITKLARTSVKVVAL